VLKRRVFNFLDVSIPGDKYGYWFDQFMIVLILLNVLAIVLETVPEIDAAYATLFYRFELFSVVVFTIEYALRLWSCTENKANNYSHPILGRIRFIFSPMALIDLLAFLPFYLTAFIGIDLRILRILRMLRLLKLSRYSPALTIIWDVFVNQRRALTAAFFVMVIALLFTSSIIYVFESAAQPEKFGSIPDAMWWGLATLTTVGYGDVYPITLGGKIFTFFVLMIGVGLVTVPAGLVATALSKAREKEN
jgi:voltage-gated potassium channel